MFPSHEVSQSRSLPVTMFPSHDVSQSRSVSQSRYTNTSKRTIKSRSQRRSANKNQPIITINRSLNYMPSRLRTTLKYNTSGILNNAGVVFANVRLKPTDAYDVDPTLGSTSMPGFTELAAIYRYYRVRACLFKADFSNRESFPLMAYVALVNQDPGQNSSAYQNYLSSRRTKTYLS